MGLDPEAVTVTRCTCVLMLNLPGTAVDGVSRALSFTS